MSVFNWIDEHPALRRKFWAGGCRYSHLEFGEGDSVVRVEACWVRDSYDQHQAFQGRWAVKIEADIMVYDDRRGAVLPALKEANDFVCEFHRRVS